MYTMETLPNKVKLYSPLGLVRFYGTINDDDKYIYGRLYFWNTRTYFEGKFDGKTNKRSGCGTEYFKNGTEKYLGTYKNDLYHGRGREKYNTGQIKYDGEFREGKYHGKGILYFPDGSIKYDGFFKAGLYTGHNGKLYNNNEQKLYEGDFEKGKMHGAGVLSKNGEVIFAGQFENGIKNLTGIYYYNYITQSIKYIGPIKYGKMHGVFGDLRRPDKSKEYYGDFKNNMKCGIGEQYYISGEVEYKGPFKHNKKDGYGEEFYEGGEKKYTGNFKNDLYHGKGELYHKNGVMRMCGTWKHGGFIYGSCYDIDGELI